MWTGRNEDPDWSIQRHVTTPGADNPSLLPVILETSTRHSVTTLIIHSATVLGIHSVTTLFIQCYHTGYTQCCHTSYTQCYHIKAASSLPAFSILPRFPEHTAVHGNCHILSTLRFQPYLADFYE